jgi:hypothetical protein
MINLEFLSPLLIVILTVAVVVCIIMIQQLQKEVLLEKKEKQQPFLTFCFNGPEDHFSIKNVGITPVSLVTIQDLKIELLLDYQKSVTLRFEPIPMLDPREIMPLKFKIYDGQYPLHIDAQNSLLPHLKASGFEAQISYRDWQNVPHQVVIVKDKDRFFSKS